MKKEIIYLLVAIALCSIVYAGNASLTININLAPTNSTNTTCTPSWSCSSWSACQSNSLQTRTCPDTNNCNNLSSQPSLSQSCTYTPPSSGSSGSSHHSSGGGSSSSFQPCGGTLCGLNHVCQNNTCVDITTGTATPVKTPVIPVKEPTIEEPIAEEPTKCEECTACPEPVKLDDGLYCNNNEDCKSGLCELEYFAVLGKRCKYNPEATEEPATDKPFFTKERIPFYIGILVLILAVCIWSLVRSKPIDMTPNQKAAYDFIVKNKDDHDMEDLKKALLDQKFPEEDIDIAIKELEKKWI